MADAKAIDVLQAQIDRLYPGRNKSSDGTLGDAAHRARASDHNPNSAGFVCAVDFTHDPASGLDVHKLAETMRQKKDRRLQYIISNRRIANRDIAGFAWRPYSGASPHTLHAHFSLRQNKDLYNDTTPWDLGEPMKQTGPQKPGRPRLKLGSQGADVERLQRIIGVANDGDFGPQTEKAVQEFQKAHGLVPDGVVGPYTWEKLDAAQPPSNEAPKDNNPARPTIFRANGKMSTFGGKSDTGVKPTEGLALFQSEADMSRHGLGDFLVPATDAGAPGLARRLNPDMPYIACRWDTTTYPLLRDAVAYVTANGVTVKARPVDWGPAERTGRIADLSPGLARQLGLKTDDDVRVVVYKDGR